jgi:predicted PurR-regulated permease PerM
MSPVGQPDWRKWVVGASALVVAAMLVAAAYLARAILIPIALAILIAFVLSPIVKWMEKRGLGRLPAVLATVGCAVICFGLVAWAVSWQMATLTEELPNYTDSIKAKVRDAREQILGTGQGRFGSMIEEISEEVDPDKKQEKDHRAKGMGGGFGSTGPAAQAAPAATPAQVTVKPPGSTGLDWVEQLVSPAMEIIGQAAFAFILAVFMLVKREDLRNRLIRLIGHDDRLMATTRAVDDASRRVSRYLFMQLLVNSTFGLVITVTLLAIGAKYALLWGFLASVMRYVPYIGTWLGLIPPVITSLAMSDGLWQPLTIIAVYGGLELLSNNVIEPWLYGSHTGLSEVAQLVATAFWALLWGPIGLVLAAPLTVCLLVLGKYVPQLHFLEVLLGDEPVLPPHVSLYQRLAARDQDEATDIAAEAVKSSSLESALDDVLVPALSLVTQAEQNHTLSQAEAQFAYESLREIVAEICEPAEQASEPADGEPPVELLAVPARGEADEVILGMFVGLLDPRQWNVTLVGQERLTAEVVSEAGANCPHVILIGSVPPGGWARARYLCKRLRARCPKAHILVAFGGTTEVKDQVAALTAAGADQVCTSIASTARHLRGWRAVSDVQDPSVRPSPTHSRRTAAEAGTVSA